MEQQWYYMLPSRIDQQLARGAAHTHATACPAPTSTTSTQTVPWREHSWRPGSERMKGLTESLKQAGTRLPLKPCHTPNQRSRKRAALPFNGRRLRWQNCCVCSRSVGEKRRGTAHCYMRQHGGRWRSANSLCAAGTKPAKPLQLRSEGPNQQCCRARRRTRNASDATLNPGTHRAAKPNRRP